MSRIAQATTSGTQLMRVKYSVNWVGRRKKTSKPVCAKPSNGIWLILNGWHTSKAAATSSGLIRITQTVLTRHKACRSECAAFDVKSLSVLASWERGIDLCSEDY